MSNPPTNDFSKKLNINAASFVPGQNFNAPVFVPGGGFGGAPPAAAPPAPQEVAPPAEPVKVEESEEDWDDEPEEAKPKEEEKPEPEEPKEEPKPEPKEPEPVPEPAPKTESEEPEVVEEDVVRYYFKSCPQLNPAQEPYVSFKKFIRGFRKKFNLTLLISFLSDTLMLENLQCQAKFLN